MTVTTHAHVHGRARALLLAASAAAGAAALLLSALATTTDAATCASPTFVDTYPGPTASLPTLPTTPFAGSYPTGNVSRGHYSAAAVLSAYRAPSWNPTASSDAAQVDCPHAQAGLKYWHDPSIWPGGVLPGDGANFTVPAGKVLVSSCSVDPSYTF